MVIRKLDSNNLASVMDVFCEAFRDDKYYAKIFTDPETRIKDMRDSFAPSIEFCISRGNSYGAFQDDRLISFIIFFDYKDIKANHENQFREIFGGSNNRDIPLPYKEAIHDRINKIDGKVLYLVSIASTPEYQNMGIASSLIDYVLNKYSNCSLVGDVSNSSSLGIYKKRNFVVTEIEPNYFFICQDRKKKFTQLALERKTWLLYHRKKSS